MKYQVKNQYDPSYGMKIMPVGTIVEINIIGFRPLEREVRIVAASNGEVFGGWGMLISDYELETYFVKLGGAE